MGRADLLDGLVDVSLWLTQIRETMGIVERTVCSSETYENNAAVASALCILGTSLAQATQKLDQMEDMAKELLPLTKSGPAGEETPNGAGGKEVRK